MESLQNEVNEMDKTEARRVALIAELAGAS